MSEYSFETFTITIAKSAETCRIEAQGPDHITRCDTKQLLPIDNWLTPEARQTLDKLKSNDATPEQIKDLGRELFHGVFTPSIAEAYALVKAWARRTGKRYRVSLVVELEELARIPWEAMYDDTEEVWLATQSTSPLVRKFPAKTAGTSLKVSGPLHILFVGAADLAMAKEVFDKIDQYLAPLKKQGKVQFDFLNDPDARAFKQALEKGGYHILYFAGHGRSDGIYLKNKQKFICSKQLADMIEGQSIRLVFLHACDTATDENENQLLDGVAQTLVQRTSLPAIVAMQYSVYDTSTASNFAAPFFNSLAGFNPVDKAFADARPDLRNRDALAPVLYLQVKDGAFFVRDTTIALPRKLAVEALRHIDNQLDLTLLLSAQAQQIYDTVEARNSLLAALQHQPHLTTFLPDHTDNVTSVAFSPDGLTLATGGAGGAIFLWDVARSRLRATLRHDDIGANYEVSCVTFSPNGQILAATLTSGSEDLIILWEAANVQGEAANAQRLGEPINASNGGSLAFSPDGRLLAFGDYLPPVYGGPDNQALISDGENGVKVLDWATRKQWGWFLTQYSVACLAFSPDGRYLAAGDGVTLQWGDVGTVYLFELNAGRQLGQLFSGHKSYVECLAFSPDSRLLASGSRDKTIILWDVALGRPLDYPLVGHEGSISSLAFSRSGQILASGSFDKTIILWDVATHQRRGERLAGHRYFINSVAFSPRDNNVLASGGNGGTVILWNVNPPLRLGERLVGHDDTVNSVEFVEFKGQPALVSGSHNGQTFLWDVKARRQLGQLEHGASSMRSMAWSPVTRILALGTDLGIVLWDTTSGQELPGQPLPAGEAWDLSFNHDGQILAARSLNYDALNQGHSDYNTITLWDMTTRERLPDLPQGHGMIRRLVFHPEKPSILTVADERGIIKTWDYTTPESPKISDDFRIPPNTASESFGLTYSSRGQFLAAGDVNGTIRMWEVESGTLLYEISTGHGFPITDLAFSPDDKILASIDEVEGIVILWDVETGQQIGRPFAGHTDGGWRLAFSPDGKILASSSYDHTIILWDVDPMSWRRRARARANRKLTQAEWDLFIGTDL